MPKRIYIAVGSTAIHCIRKLIERCIEENVYQTDGQSALYVGLDSDKKELDALLRMDSDRSHIRAVHIGLERTDPACRVVQAFRPDWTDLSIGQHGVGGDRRRSFAALTWAREDELHDTVSELEAADELILVGTAFGGTATGSYWNLAQWLRQVLKSARDQRVQNDPDAGVPGFYSFLVFPSAPGATNGDYPLVGNLCDFLKDAQVLDVSVRLKAQLNLPFGFPVVSALRGDEFVPLWNKETQDHSEDSWLPFDCVFTVPTPPGGMGQVPIIAAEQMFLLGPLGLWNKLGVTGQAVNRPGAPAGAEGAYDLAFGGFNMVAAKSGKNALLRKRFHALLHERFRSFLSRGSSSGSEGRRWAIGLVEKFIDRDTDHASIEGQMRELRNLFEGELPALAQHLDERLREFRKYLTNYPYRWTRFGDFLDHAVRHGGPVPADLCLEDLVHAYNESLEYLRHAGENADAYRQNMADAASKAVATVDRRQQSKVARLLNYTRAVELEVREKLRVSLQASLDDFVIACRAAATLKALPPNVSLEQEKRQNRYVDIDAFLAHKTKQTNGVALHECMHEESGENVQMDTLQLGADYLTEKVLELLATGNDAEREAIVKGAESEASRILLQHARELGPMNPLNELKINIRSTKLKPYSRIFAVRQCQMFHNLFYVQYGAAGTVTWGELTDDLGMKVFGVLDPKRNVDDVFRHTSYQRRFYLGVNENQDNGIHGVWIGSMRLDCELGELVRQIYAGENVENWQATVLRGRSLGGGLRRLMTLPEAMALGTLLGVIERAVSRRNEEAGGGVLNSENLAVTIACDKRRDGPLVLALSNSQLNSCFRMRPGFEHELQLTHVPTRWIRELMEWVRDTFWDDMEMAGSQSFRTRMQYEDLILTQLSLSVPNELVEGLQELSEKLTPAVTVEL